jgi:hypothetical protein
MFNRNSTAEKLAPIEAEILFCEERTKKIAADSGTNAQLKNQCCAPLNKIKPKPPLPHFLFPVFRTIV